MDVFFHVKCMFPKTRLSSFARTPRQVFSLTTAPTAKISDIMRDSLDILVMNGIDKANIQIASVNESDKQEIFITILDNINVFKIAKMLGLEKPFRSSKKKILNLGDRYFVVSFDSVRAGAI